MSSKTVDNPFFARLWTVMSTHEPDAIKALRRENLAGLSGPGARGRRGHRDELRVVSRDGDGEVVAVEPERRLAAMAQQAAESASVPVTVSTDTVEQFSAE